MELLEELLRIWRRMSPEHRRQFIAEYVLKTSKAEDVVSAVKDWAKQRFNAETSLLYVIDSLTASKAKPSHISTSAAEFMSVLLAHGYSGATVDAEAKTLHLKRSKPARVTFGDVKITEGA